MKAIEFPRARPARERLPSDASSNAPQYTITGLYSTFLLH
jgi:hypothetical protein